MPENGRFIGFEYGREVVLQHRADAMLCTENGEGVHEKTEARMVASGVRLRKVRRSQASSHAQQSQILN